MSDTTTYVHMTVTVITSVIAVVLAYLKFKDDKLSKQEDKSNVCKQDFQELQTKVAVLEERITNETHLLDKLEDKLDEIRNQL